MLTDSHCHLYDEKLKEDLPKILGEIESKNMLCVCCGADVETSKKCLNISKENKNVYATVGFHPECLAHFEEIDIKKLEGLAKNKKVVAIGEIGLDYYYCKDTKEKQKEVLISQILLADKLGLPMVFHIREAMGDFLEILEEYKTKINHSCVVHSFSGSIEVAKILVKKGFYLGINGIVTFKNARSIVDVVREIPLKHLLIETDSPYLTPVPFRGKNNEPKFVEYVARQVALIKGISEEEVKEATCFNTKKLFQI